MTTIITRPSPPSCPLSVAHSSLPRGAKVWSKLPAARSGRVSDGPRATDHQPRTRRSSAQALAMLTRQPVFVATLPRFHVKPRGIDGTLLVVDRASDEQFTVYTPRFMPQFPPAIASVSGICGPWEIATSLLEAPAFPQRATPSKPSGPATGIHRPRW